MRQLNVLLRDHRGATAIEYCLIAAFISLMLVAGAQAIGFNLLETLNAALEGMSRRPA